MEQPFQGYSSTLALHVAQEAIPLGSTAKSQQLAVPSTSASTEQAQYLGYGPLPSSSPTPLNIINQQHIHPDSEYSFLCAPLSNANWRQRWERMCVVSPSNGPTTASSSKLLSGQYESFEQLDEDVNATAQRIREAELWRQAGAFRRGEVNATRSGQSKKISHENDERGNMKLTR